MAKKVKITSMPHKFSPRWYQEPLFDCIANGYLRGVAVWHRRAGKDKTLINIMGKEMFRRVGVYYYFFPTFKQGRMMLWEGIDGGQFRFMDHIPEDVRERTNDQEMRIHLQNGSVFQVVGTDNIDSIMGTNPVGCVFSEYSLQKPGGWDLVRPILADNGGWALFNSTPRGLNHLYEIYQMARREPDWFCELLTVDETGAITVEQIDKERRAGMPESLVQQEFYCDFTASSPDKLIDLGIIEDAAGRHLVEGSYRHAPKVLGVDPSRFGDDKFCWVKRQGLAAFDLEKHSCSGPDELDFVVSKLMFTIRAFNPDAVFVDDTGGYGSEVTYRLRRLGYPVVGINFAKKASKPSRYANKRAEMYDNLKQWLISGGAIPDDLDLKKDLGVIPYSFDRQNRLGLMKKAKIKSELMRSPDAGDALAITFAQDIFARRDLDDHYPGGGSVSVGDYDVLNFHNNDGVAI